MVHEDHLLEKLATFDRETDDFLLTVPEATITLRISEIRRILAWHRGHKSWLKVADLIDLFKRT